MVGLSLCSPTLLLLLLLLLRPQPGWSQMESPLKGQGSPRPETRDVFVSAYLDRLLSVDDQNYRFEATFVIYLSWNDSQAHYTIANTTAAVAAGQHQCQKPCTDWADDISCCDGIYLPSFYFRNAYHWPQDRPTGFKIYALAPPNGSVLWTQVVHGQWYQFMDLRHFPFDKFDLGVVMEFLDSSSGTHPGVAVHASSGGTRLYTLGLGDAVSDWGVRGMSMSVADNVNSGSLFKLSSSLASHPRDPLPLSTGRAAVLRGTLPGASTTNRINPVRLVYIKIRVARFWSYNLLNTIVPVSLIGVICSVVFFLPRRDLGTRLGVLVTLLLALTAVQFVISEHTPSSSYVLPTQQQVIMTYCLLALVALESIVVFHVETWKERGEEARRRREARDRYLASRQARREEAQKEAAINAAAAAAGELAGPAVLGPAQQRGALLGGAYSAGMEVTQPNEQSGHSMGRSMGRSMGSSEAGLGVSVEPMPATPKGRDSPTSFEGGGGPAAAAGSPSGGSGGGGAGAAGGRGLSRMQSLRESLRDDSAYDAYCAYVIDRACLGAFLLLYCLGTVLIYTLQQGYIALFPEV